MIGLRYFLGNAFQQKDRKMRLTIQNKLLLPIIAAVVALMLCSTLLITRLVTDRLVAAYNQELEIASLGLNKTAQQASQNYKSSILGIMLAGAVLVGLIVFCVVRPIIKALLQGVDYAKAVSDPAAQGLTGLIHDMKQG